MSKYTCPHCGRKFPMWYWAIPNRAGSFGMAKYTGTAWANFERHKNSCKKKKEKNHNE